MANKETICRARRSVVSAVLVAAGQFGDYGPETIWGQGEKKTIKRNLRGHNDSVSDGILIKTSSRRAGIFTSLSANRKIRAGPKPAQLITHSDGGKAVVNSVNLLPQLPPATCRLRARAYACAEATDNRRWPGKKKESVGVAADGQWPSLDPESTTELTNEPTNERPVRWVRGSTSPLAC